MNQEERLQNIEEKLEKILALYETENFPDRMVLYRALQLKNKSGNTVFDTTSGLKLGDASTQISLYGGNPVSKQASILAPIQPSATYSQSEAISAVDAINNIRNTLANFGITS